MFSIPYSRYFIYPIPWYSFLIVIGVALAVILACREERRLSIKKDTVIDLSLWLMPAGIIGARIYYVLFSWDQFRSDLLSVFRIWEGGIAIYGAIISGLIVIIIFSRSRRISPFLLCDLIAPGLILAQGIGRWGNYFNMEAYGLPLHNPTLCFFPLAVQIYENGSLTWHMATFFYESIWDLSIFCFLMYIRRKQHRHGDLFLFYAFLYAAGRFVIEDLRLDSLVVFSFVRISQLLSSLVCVVILLYYFHLSRKNGPLNRPGRLFAVPMFLVSSCFQIVYSFSGKSMLQSSIFIRLLLLAGSSILVIISLIFIYPIIPPEVPYANNKN